MVLHKNGGRKEGRKEGREGMRTWRKKGTLMSFNARCKGLSSLIISSHDAMRCDAMRFDAMRCDAMRCAESE
jgi:hypothetical protein